MKTFKELYKTELHWTDEEFDKFLELGDDELLEYLIKYNHIWLEEGIFSKIGAAVKKFGGRVMGAKQRKKMARRMAKMGKSKIVQAKKKRAALRMRSPAKLAILARKKAIQMMRDKFYPAYKTMALAQRVKVDQVIMQKYGKKIAKIAKKLTIKLKKAEIERVKKARAAQKDA